MYIKCILLTDAVTGKDAEDSTKPLFPRKSED